MEVTAWLCLHTHETKAKNTAGLKQRGTLQTQRRSAAKRATYTPRKRRAVRDTVQNEAVETQSAPSVQFSPVPQSSLTQPRARQASLSITNSRSSPKLMCVEPVMPSSHLIFCRPLLLLPSVFPSIRVFSNESTPRIRWPKYWSFSFNIRPSNEHPGLISFRMDWLDLLAVQGTLKSLLQHHSSKA